MTEKQRNSVQSIKNEQISNASLASLTFGISLKANSALIPAKSEPSSSRASFSSFRVFGNNSKTLCDRAMSVMSHSPPVCGSLLSKFKTPIPFHQDAWFSSSATSIQTIYLGNFHFILAQNDALLSKTHLL